MKNLLVHGVYLSVIAVLSFLLYDKTKIDDFVFEKSSEALTSDFNNIKKVNVSIAKAIRANTEAQPKYAGYLDIVQKALDFSLSLESKINAHLSQKHITENEKDLLKKDALKVWEQNFSLIASEFREELKKKSHSITLLKNDSFWLSMKKSSEKRLENQLNTIKNNCLNDNALIMNYCLDRTSGREHTGGGDWFKVAIAPKKTFLVEGEKMEAEIYLAAYSKTNSNNISVKVNNNKLPTREGVAFFEEKPNIGEHIIQATITIRNPFTGNTETVKGELKYEVLPKCSRDCAKNQ
jgi:hypothetical protein